MLQQVSTALAVEQQCKGNNLLNINALPQILATLPVTAAESERKSSNKATAM